MSEQFCTYFDHLYAPKGLAMWRSLKKVSATATLHVLCLNEACRTILAGLHLPDVHLLGLNELEAENPGLLAARGNRSLVEYYFTLTPYLPLHIFKARPEISRLTYVDADLFFLADPRPVLDEVGENAVGLIEHRFPSDLVDFEKHGRFNVGWLTFRNDPVAFQCLNVWREQCLAWCYDWVETDRFAEQKYLDEWPARFPGIRIIQHRGANVAPWNLNRFEISSDGDNLKVGGEPLLFFHAHGFKPASPGGPREPNLSDYHVEETALIQRAIFDPYEKALIEATSEIAFPLALALLSNQPREAPSLREALEASEADRAARLDVIQRLQQQLDASYAKFAVQLGVLQEQLEVIERERVAGVNEIQTFRQRQEKSEADLVESQTHLAQVRSRLDVVERSRSWRWTSPARRLAGWLRSGR